MRNASGEDDPIGDAERRSLCLERHLLRAATEQQHAQLGPLRQQGAGSFEQK